MRVPQSGLRVDSPSWPLLQAHISYWGVTTAGGNALGTTLVCAGLANEPSYDGLPVKILSGGAAGQVRTIQVHNGNTLTVGVAFTDSTGAVQSIGAGTLFVILSIGGGGGGPGPAPPEGLWYYGVVDAVPGANQFTIGSLAGLGAGKFDGATNPYYAFVLRDAGGAGAAPQGEQQAITAYVTATGVFTTAAFTAAVAVGDEILILHPDLATALIILADLAVPAADSVANVLERDVIGNKTDTAILASDNVSSAIRYLKGILNTVVAVNSGFQEQPDTAVNITAIVAAETDVFNLAVAATRYMVRSLRLKCADPGAETITVRLYELINDVLTVVDIFEITTANFATHHSLMDMFGIAHLAGDNLKVTVQASAAGPYAITGQYSWAQAS